ncbi:MAG: tRNA (guanine(10)-N(2))-dimethyltransferase [Candidatus Lokiarchaeota archaeon]|nr:tRNA (guanine(10)-N(2))-dimethyltransferase [Candidatus Lokiarchaeota archaeon]
MIEKEGKTNHDEELAIKTEGKAKFYMYEADENQIPSKSMKVFYNEKMIINRDITTLAINAYNRTFAKELVVVDSMAASGIGSMRLMLECQGIKRIYINDINPIAVELINKNLVLNQLDGTAHQDIILSRKDANFLFSELAQESLLSEINNISRPNVVSIDPFGAPNLYINSAFNAIQRTNGLICVTATDTAVLFGIKPQACVRKYMSKPLHVEYCKEIGARILFHFISRMANINKMGVVPLLTFYSNHFIRIFALTFKHQKKVAADFSNYGYIIHCKVCNNRIILENILDLPKNCSYCGEKAKIDYAGPLWLGKLHDEIFLKQVYELNEACSLKNKKRIKKILICAQGELNMPISYYNIHKLSQTLNLRCVPKMEDLILKITECGFKASRTHFDFTSIKTDLKLDELKKLLLKNYNNGD